MSHNWTFATYCARVIGFMLSFTSSSLICSPLWLTTIRIRMKFMYLSTRISSSWEIKQQELQTPILHSHQCKSRVTPLQMNRPDSLLHSNSAAPLYQSKAAPKSAYLAFRKSPQHTGNLGWCRVAGVTLMSISLLPVTAPLEIFVFHQ